MSRRSSELPPELSCESKDEVEPEVKSRASKRKLEGRPGKGRRSGAPAGSAVRRRILKSKLHANRSFHGCDILPVQPADPLPQAELADRAQLIRHCLALLSPE